ncbi:hypothetical protein SARC_04516 [Sphaeroforma arctica JP610]|uniref:ribonuclease Z n=1 Tax=Sphaeroforma arctica JP610 TaxID=667725 RepID=A0A0L0G4R6_9EUKA|nr:hypothetical protein SARC_04516 [Sphaeroforma arctica JP610]KNC83238.1 hypothetical protein SARC_04516 [Sphaeroforma arctica JP610]|eukprot:XP_014157140.1 hypothetical protein SARC_04516 [Sphaeroforma arctica JP610]
MHTLLKIIGTATGDSSPSVMLVFDKKKYLFNCGEGFQRLATEQTAKLAKVDSIFLTRLRWRNLGGLPGVLLSLAGIGATSVTVHGPANLHHFFHGTNNFMNTGLLGVNVREYDFKHAGEDGQTNSTSSTKPVDVYNDRFVKITPVLIQPLRQDEEPELKRARTDTGSEVRSHDQTYTPLTEEQKKVMLAHLAPAKSRYNDLIHQQIPAPKKGVQNDVVCYMCELQPAPPKFDAKKAVELCIPKGSIRADLVKGKTITLKDGTAITPDMVTTKSPKGYTVLIIDCPSADYIPALTAAPEWKVSQATDDSSNPQPLVVVVHKSPISVLNDERYATWAASFGKTADHVLINEDLCDQSTVYKSQERLQAKLNIIDEKIFAMPDFSTRDPAAAISALDFEVFRTQGRVGSPQMEYRLEPAKKAGFLPPAIDLHNSLFTIMCEAKEILAENPTTDGQSDEAKEILAENPTTDEQSDEAKEILAENPTTDEQSETKHQFPHADKDVEVLFLGTGSAIPSKYRNVSSTALRIPDIGSIMLDSGEGTYGQLRRMLGREGVQKFVDDIKCVYISHMHADHHLGLIQLLANRSASCPPLLVVAPNKMRIWLNLYSALEPISFEFVSANAMSGGYKANNHLHQKALLASLRKQMGITLDCVGVIHTKDATGVALSHESGWKVVYSGDTRPCGKLAAAGAGATILIHEATFEEEMLAEAKAKNHSTTMEAVLEGGKMNAGLIVLNHFSQRYPQVPKIDARFTDRTAIAFDLMRFEFKDMPRLPKMLSRIQLLFSEEEARLHEITEAREC